MKTVLVIEDEALIRANILTILQMNGYATLEADDGHTGLHLALEHRPDLIISDIIMPSMDGLTVVREFRASTTMPSVPILLLSGRADTVDVDEGLRLGANGYLIKPFRIPEFIDAVNKLMNTTGGRT